MCRLARAAFGVPALLRVRGGRPSMSPGLSPLCASSSAPPSQPASSGSDMSGASALRRIAEISRAACVRAAGGAAARRAFLRAPPPPPRLSDAELSEIAACVGRVSASDLGLARSRFSGADTKIAYVPVAESPVAVMAVFVLPPGTRIPLHDHPDMCVFSKVLWGELQVQSFDVVPGVRGSGAKVGIRNADERSPAGDVRVLDPVQGNVHCFRSDRWTAVFDVVVPPYDEDAGRECTYYAPEAPDGGAIGERVVLHAVKPPADFLMYNDKYTGIEVQI